MFLRILTLPDTDLCQATDIIIIMSVADCSLACVFHIRECIYVCLAKFTFFPGEGEGFLSRIHNTFFRAILRLPMRVVNSHRE